MRRQGRVKTSDTKPPISPSEIPFGINQSDCIKGMAGLPEGIVDLAFADPPFNIGYDYDVYEDSKESKEYLDWCRKWISGVYRILKPEGTFWLAIGDEFAAELKIISQEVGFHCRSWVVWYYTFGVNCKTKFSRSHAHLFYFVKDKRNFVFRDNDPANRIPSARQLVYADSRANPNGRLPDDTWVKLPAGMVDGFDPSEQSWVLRPQDLAGCFSSDEDTWYFPRVAGTFKERAGFHGCQMPEQLLGRIVRTCSNEGARVFDPFVGSATTLVVAKKLGRQYLGFELSPEYVERGRRRLDSAWVGDRLEGSPEPTVSAPSTPKKTARANRRESQNSSARNGTDVLLPQSDLRRLEHDLKRAYQRSHQGYSADRVVVDPEINSEFADACRSLDIPGELRIWNRLLFRMRKGGLLADVPTAKRTAISWKDCDDYVFASEIAWQSLSQKFNVSLDEILCDPSLADEFDDIARQYAPNCTSLQYRWAALKLRKKASDAKQTGIRLKLPPLKNEIKVKKLNLSQIPNSAGVYLIKGRNGRLNIYGGGTLSLRNRFERHAQCNWLNPFSTLPELSVSIFESDSSTRLIMAYQTKLVFTHPTELNRLADVAA